MKYTKLIDSSLTKPLTKKLGPKSRPINFDKQDLTPEQIHYGEDANSIDSDHVDLKIITEIGEYYIGTETLIPSL